MTLITRRLRTSCGESGSEPTILRFVDLRPIVGPGAPDEAGQALLKCGTNWVVISNRHEVYNNSWYLIWWRYISKTRTLMCEFITSFHFPDSDCIIIAAHPLPFNTYPSCSHIIWFVWSPQDLSVKTDSGRHFQYGTHCPQNLEQLSFLKLKKQYYKSRWIIMLVASLTIRLRSRKRAEIRGD